MSTLKTVSFATLWLLVATWSSVAVGESLIDLPSLNRQRVSVGLPPLDGSDEEIIWRLEAECGRGIEGSCNVLQQIDTILSEKTKYSGTEYESGPLQGLPVLNDVPSANQGSDDHCAECLNYRGNSDVMKAFCASYLANRNCH